MEGDLTPWPPLHRQAMERGFYSIASEAWGAARRGRARRRVRAAARVSSIASEAWGAARRGVRAAARVGEPHPSAVRRAQAPPGALRLACGSLRTGSLHRQAMERGRRSSVTWRPCGDSRLEEEEGVCAGIAFAGLDLADVDVVVAAGDDAVDGAVHVGDGVVEAGRAGLPDGVLDLGELLGPVDSLAAGEVGGESFLIRAQDIHREGGRFLEDLQHVRVLVDADQDQGRLQGDRAEGVGGHAVVGRGAPRRHHGDPGGELAADVAEVSGVEVRHGASPSSLQSTGGLG